MKKRIIMSVFGVMLCAVSVAFFKYAAFGMDAFQVFVNGMTEVFRDCTHESCKRIVLYL